MIISALNTKNIASYHGSEPDEVHWHKIVSKMISILQGFGQKYHDQAAWLRSKR